MKKRFWIFLIILITVFFYACKMDADDSAESGPEPVSEPLIGWNLLGGFVSGGRGSTMDFVMDSNDAVYVAYRNDYDSSFSTPNLVTVKKYNNGKWKTVGGENFSDGSALYINIEVDSSGTPFVGYTDDTGSGYNPFVMKYTGNTETDNDAKINDGWEYVGSEGFTGGLAFYLDLVIDSADNLYVAYADGVYEQKLSVMKYTGNTETDNDAKQNDGWEYVEVQVFHMEHSVLPSWLLMQTIFHI